MTRSAWISSPTHAMGVPVGESSFVRLGKAGPAPRDLAPSQPAPRAADALLAAYVPEVVASRILAGHADWIAEFRGVTALFVGLVGLDPAPALGTIQVAMATFQDILRQHGGTAYQAAMDDKGTVLIGVFGLPPRSQENGASRGVEAALALRAVLLEAGLRSSVGVATGQAFCGTYGGPTRRQYAVVGSVMNLAARLMVAAGDGVLCDTATEERARGRITFDDAPSLSPKGFPGPVRVFVPRVAWFRPTSGNRSSGGPRRERVSRPSSSVSARDAVGSSSSRARRASASRRSSRRPARA